MLELAMKAKRMVPCVLELELPMVRLSKICKLAPESRDYPLAITFDRVFFLDCSERHVVELNTILGASRGRGRSSYTSAQDRSRKR
jgi:hypothetical protein